AYNERPHASHDSNRRGLSSFPTRRSSDLKAPSISETLDGAKSLAVLNVDQLTPELVNQTLNIVLKYEGYLQRARENLVEIATARSEEHTSELQSRENLVCRLLLEKKTVIL